jgi:prevent-host-death family protein
MKTYTMSDAKTNLSALVEEAEHGEQVLIMRGSKPAVILVPVSEDQLSFAPMGMTASLRGAVSYAPSTLPVFEIGSVEGA